MARRRGGIKIRYIMDRAERKRTLEKRLPNLLKKAREFAVLCDVPTSLLVYLPGKDQPVVWPSQEAALDVVRRYKEVGDLQRFKNNLDGAEFIRKMIDKAKAELCTVQRQTRDKEMNLLIDDFFAGRRRSFDDLSPEVFAALESTVEKKLRAVTARQQELLGGAVLPPLPTQLVQPPPLVMAPTFSSNLPPLPPALDASDVSGLTTTDELQAFFMNGDLP
ncbi:hypothetical protein ACQ4PT_067578 [Festuca glaucescens]